MGLHSKKRESFITAASPAENHTKTESLIAGQQETSNLRAEVQMLF